MTPINRHFETIEQLLAKVGRDDAAGSIDWLSSLLAAIIEAHGSTPNAEEIQTYAAAFAALYVRRSTVRKFAGMVRDMRKAQREYFNTRTPAWLERAKSDEHAVDKWVEAALKSPTQQQRTLFDTTPKGEEYR